MTNTILCKEGYLIPKNTENSLLINNIKKELTVKPFQIGNFIKKNTEFCVYQENDSYISIPKHYGLKKIGKPNFNKEIIGLTVNFNFKGKLRKEQEEISNIIIPYIQNNDGGVLCLPCAAGKTVLSLYIANVFKLKTLVIVHKTFLLNQWKERAEQFTDAKIGMLQQNKIDIDGKDIVIGMLQSIVKDKYDPEIFRDFGLVIYDEAHHAPSKYFSKALPIIASKLTLGLSATPFRDDKLEKILYWYLGDIMYMSPVLKNSMVSVKIFKYDIEHEKFKQYFMRNGDINRPKTITKITTIGRRNKFIIDLLEDVLKEDKRKVLILSDRIEHLHILKNRLDKRKITTTDFYIGGMKQKLLKKAELATVIFASYGMAAEALDIPDLNTLFMVTSRGKVEQSVGRVIRKIDPNVRPLIYDFTDQLPCFVNQGYQRRRLYKKLGFEISIIEMNGEVINNNIININDNMINEECEDFID